MAELLGPILQFDVRADLAKIDLPTLVVVGSRDVITPVRRVRAMAEGIPGARFVILAGAGHLVMLERPEEFEALLEQFSSELPA